MDKPAKPAREIKRGEIPNRDQLRVRSHSEARPPGSKEINRMEVPRFGSFQTKGRESIEDPIPRQIDATGRRGSDSTLASALIQSSETIEMPLHLPNDAIEEINSIKSMIQLLFTSSSLLTRVLLSIDWNPTILLHLLKVYETNGAAVSLLSTLMDFEINKQESSVTLFRTDRVGSVMLAAYAKLIGQKYLHSVLWPIFQKVASEPVSKYEGDKKKMSDSHANACVREYENLVKEILRRILASTKEIPMAFYQICHRIRSLVKEKFTVSRDAPALGVSSFFFLRIICPCLVAPETFGFDLTDLHLTAGHRRVLLLATKIIQTTANLTNFNGTKEPIMVPYTNLVTEKTPEVRAFLLQISSGRDFDEAPRSEPMQLNDYFNSIQIIKDHIAFSYKRISRVLRSWKVPNHSKFVQFMKENLESLPEDFLKPVRKVWDCALTTTANVHDEMWYGTNKGVVAVDSWASPMLPLYMNKPLHSGPVLSIRSDSTYAWSADASSLVVWQIEKRRPVATQVFDIDNSIVCLETSPKGHATGHKNGLVRVYSGVPLVPVEVVLWDPKLGYDGDTGILLTSICPVGNKIWVGTNRGIVFIIRLSQSPPTFISFDLSLSSPSQDKSANKIVSMCQKNKSIWVGTPKRVYIYRQSTSLHKVLALDWPMTHMVLCGQYVWFNCGFCLLVYNFQTGIKIRQFICHDSSQVTTMSDVGDEIGPGIISFSEANRVLYLWVYRTGYTPRWTHSPRDSPLYSPTKRASTDHTASSSHDHSPRSPILNRRSRSADKKKKSQLSRSDSLVASPKKTSTGNLGTKVGLMQMENLLNEQASKLNQTEVLLNALLAQEGKDTDPAVQEAFKLLKEKLSQYQQDVNNTRNNAPEQQQLEKTEFLQGAFKKADLYSPALFAERRHHDDPLRSPSEPKSYLNRKTSTDPLRPRSPGVVADYGQTYPKLTRSYSTGFLLQGDSVNEAHSASEEKKETNIGGHLSERLIVLSSLARRYDHSASLSEHSRSSDRSGDMVVKTVEVAVEVVSPRLLQSKSQGNIEPCISDEK